MIRSDRGDHFLLFTQDDHALLSGELAALLGNSHFDGPEPRDRVLDAVTLHDAGWPLHDDRPTLNAQGLPLHVFETPATLGTDVWKRSADIAAERDAYTGLLVSLHVLNLSGMAVRRDMTPSERFEHRHDLFLLNQFQQNEIERQERLRTAVGLRIDRPVEMGLADPGTDGDEDRLRCNYAWLRLCDLLSLYGCIGEPGVWSAAVYPRTGPVSQSVDLTQKKPGLIEVSPWPFGKRRIDLAINARRIRREPFLDLASFGESYATSPIIKIRLSFVTR